MGHPLATLRRALATAGASLGLLALAPAAAAGQFHACARTATGSFTPNGVVASGSTLGACSAAGAWSRVVPLQLTPGASTANAAAAGTISTTYFSGSLYLGFVVEHDADLSNFDVVEVAFDRDGSGWSDGDFFLKLVVDASTTPKVSPTGGTACNDVVSVEYYRYQGGQFLLDETVGAASAVVAKSGYDFETATDAETQLWNLEVKIPTAAIMLGGNTYFGIQTTKFAMGAYVFADKDHLQTGQTGMVLRWPSALPDRQISQWDLNSPAVAATALATMSTDDVCFNVTFNPALISNPWQINGSDASAGNNGLLKPASQNNDFKVSFYYDGPGDTPAAGTNSGDVELELIPSTAAEWTPGTSWNASPVHLTVDGYNQMHSASFTLPAGTFGSNIFFLCACPRLKNWAHDDNPAVSSSCIDGDNQLHINHNWFHTSETTQVIDLRADGIPGLTPGGKGHLLVHLYSTNDPSGGGLSQGPAMPETPARAALFGSGAIFLGLAVAGRRRRGLAALFSTVAILVIAAGCRRPGGPGPEIGNARWHVTNAGELGMTALPKEPGWYQVPLKYGEVKQLRIHFQDQPLPYQTNTVHLPMADSARTGPGRTTLAVKEGEILTVLAFGEVDPDGPDGPLAPTSAAGAIRPAAQTPGLTRMAAARGYLLNNPHYLPNEYVGGLVGSFDGFQTSFPLGTNTALVVPKGATSLTLAINGTATDYRVATGEFLLKWMSGPSTTVPTAFPAGYETAMDQPNFVLPWRFLTTTTVQTFYEVPQVDVTNQQTVLTRNLSGAVRLSVYESQAR